MNTINIPQQKLITKLTEDQKAVVELLKEALAQALEGHVTSIGIVVCMEKGYAHVMAGRQAADLNLGCDSLKLSILDRVEKAGGAFRRQ
jgi:hypothetical protein